MSNTDTVAVLERLANLLRIDAIESTQEANSGFDQCSRISLTSSVFDRHPTSCASMAEITSVLFYNVMRYDPKDPRNAAADRFVLSKVTRQLCYASEPLFLSQGHCAPILYAAWAEAGAFPVADLKNLRKIDSDLEGHPTPVGVIFMACLGSHRSSPP